MNLGVITAYTSDDKKTIIDEDIYAEDHFLYIQFINDKLKYYHQESKKIMNTFNELRGSMLCDYPLEGKTPYEFLNCFFYIDFPTYTLPYIIETPRNSYQRQFVFERCKKAAEAHIETERNIFFTHNNNPRYLNIRDSIMNTLLEKYDINVINKYITFDVKEYVNA
jgi:hypothetical protein